MLKNYFPVWLSLGKEYYHDEAMLTRYYEKYEWITGWLQYVTAIIRNDEGAILVGFNKKHQAWQIPSGKVDKGEGYEETIIREVKEELSLDVKEMTYKGKSRVIFYGMPWEGHFYEVKVQGELHANELDTMVEFDWVKFVPSDSWLGFAVESEVAGLIEDPQKIIQERHMFTEVFWMENVPEFLQMIDLAKPLIPMNVDKDALYMQYRDKEQNIFTAVQYDEYLELIAE